jgi:hypothetical protein
VALCSDRNVHIYFTIGRGSFVFLILDNRFLWLTKSKYPLMSRVSALLLVLCCMCFGCHVLV